jgi:phage terminase large subunit
MSATVERVQLPHQLRFYDHQREAIQAFRGGATRAIWRWHRQGGKGAGALGWVGMSAFERPGTYLVGSPTKELCRENFCDARDPDSGERYRDLVFPPPIVVETNENELSMEILTVKAGQTSRIVFRSADDPDRLRGPAYAGVVLDEFATMPGREPLDVVRIPLERANGWLLITSTPKGLNHFHEVWKNAETAGGWYLSTKTIEDTRRHDGTPIIPRSLVEQERREGQSEEWIQQEYFVAFTSALIGAYFGEALTAAEQDGRITDVAHRPTLKVWTGWDIGISDLTVVVYFQPRHDASERIHVLGADAFEGAALPEIIATMQRHGYVFGTHYAPHDAANREKGTGKTYAGVARELGVKLTVVPRGLSLLEGINAVRSMFPRFVFDRRGCAQLVPALGAYSKLWDAKAKIFRPSPAHTQASHYADAVRSFVMGYRDRDEESPFPRRVIHAVTAFNPLGRDRRAPRLS